MFVIYGTVKFASNGQRNSAQSAVQSEATSMGLTAAASMGLPAGAVRTTVEGLPGLTISYSGPSMGVVNTAEAKAQAALIQFGYEGDFGCAEA